MRNISVALTKKQVRARAKTVTRRNGWLFVRVGELLQPVNRTMGFKKGEHPKRVGGPVRVLNVTRERLYRITPEECAREGFPDMTPEQFIEMYCAANGGDENQLVTRIAWAYER